LVAHLAEILDQHIEHEVTPLAAAKVLQYVSSVFRVATDKALVLLQRPALSESLSLLAALAESALAAALAKPALSASLPTADAARGRDSYITPILAGVPRLNVSNAVLLPAILRVCITDSQEHQRCRR
jgi:hypothetical protein